ncbi:ABC transporter permease [Tengunoibacter tsumagoiensis]|uniref:ABC transporter permease n=1 Tax=Tengunoibacter tsumagoiensis TaxID=2014871 RepID=A0A402A0J8_9CHLR|nr:ABC-2 family transporter protein [Tengunoibacter tsumagoiensis]GCE12678.1 ABC transporter permease [Tengunoibacter tsumagoiensis]
MNLLFEDMQLYLRLILMQIRAQAQYKLNLVLDISTYFLVTACELLAVILYFVPFPTLLGWRVGEVMLLSGVVSLSFGLAEMVGSGIDDFSTMIRRGDFDRVLLRPLGAFIQIFGSDFRLRRLGRLTQGVLAIGLALPLIPQLHWTVFRVLVLVLGVISGMVIYVSVQLLGATLCFWTVETTELINLLTYGSREMMSYPLAIYHQLMQRFFLFIIPVAFGAYVPVCFVLGKALPFGLPLECAYLAPVVATLFALVVGCIWRYGVHRYQSTGS